MKLSEKKRTELSEEHLRNLINLVIKEITSADSLRQIYKFAKEKTD